LADRWFFLDKEGLKLLKKARSMYGNSSSNSRKAFKLYKEKVPRTEG